MTSTLEYYARMADAQARGPQTYGGDAQIATLRCFRRYHKDAHVDFIDVAGVPRWMTQKQLRIHGILTRMTVSGEHATMRAIAEEARACVSTVSRTVLKLQAWSVIGAIVLRGRNGGVWVFARSARDGADRFRERAEARLWAIADRAKARAKRVALNVASLRSSPEGVATTSTERDATFNREWVWDTEKDGSPWRWWEETGPSRAHETAFVDRDYEAEAKAWREGLAASLARAGFDNEDDYLANVASWR